MDALRGRHPNAKFVLCGDFNELDTTDITSHLCLTQTVEFPTYSQNTLDLILTDLTDWYLPPRPPPPHRPEQSHLGPLVTLAHHLTPTRG